MKLIITHAPDERQEAELIARFAELLLLGPVTIETKEERKDEILCQQ